MKNKTVQDYFEKGQTLLDSDDLEAIEAFIEECYQQGLAYFERESFQEAAEFFQYVSEFDPEYPDIYYHVGIAFYESNNNRQAYIAFKNAIKFDSQNKEIMDLMKKAQMKLGIEGEEDDFYRIYPASELALMTPEQQRIIRLEQRFRSTRKKDKETQRNTKKNMAKK